MKRILSVLILLNWMCLARTQDFSKLLDNPAFNQSPKLAYGTSKDFYPVSTNAASSGVFAQIPTNAFTGTAPIGIPLYVIKYKELTVPIMLNYHPSLVKPDLPPGTTGLGWTLQAGGSISRIINGTVDIGPKPATIFTEGNYPLSAVNWNSQSVIDAMKAEMSYYLPSQDPDTYIFNINGSMGEFCAAHTGEFQIISDDGSFFFVTLNKTYRNSIEYLDGFTIKDTNGNTYEFGGAAATETTRPGFNGSTYDSSLSQDAYTLPMTWCLKKISSPYGYSIIFNYQSTTTTFKSRFADYTLMNGEDQAHSSMYLDNERTYVIKGFTIKEVVFMNNKITFDYSSSSQLAYPASSPSNYDNFVWDKSPVSNAPIPVSTSGKLDRIAIYERSNKLFYYEFNYTSSTATRLKLLSVKKKSADGLLTAESHHFEYNPAPLPPYLSGQTDHYGFYNGNTFFGNDIAQKINNCISTFATPSGQQSVNVLKSTINAVKQPNAADAVAEILQKITYHTGGYTVFGYEPHEYGSTHKIWPNTVTQNPNGSMQTGGIRIKTITKYDKSGIVLEKTAYHYRKNHITGGSISSGVLAYTPEYADYFYSKDIFIGNMPNAQNKSVFFINSNPVYPLSNVHGNHITYSEVTIEKPGNNYSVFVFKNYDNGYPDKAPLAYGATLAASPASSYANPTGVVAFWQHDEGISMEQERGKIISERLFDINKNLTRQINCEYHKNESKNIRYYRLEPTCVNNTKRWSYRMTSGLRYTYFPYLSKKTETIYPDGFTNSIEYTYNEDYRLLKTEKTFDSRDNTYLKTFTYPIDRASDPVSQKMTTLKMVGYGVETNAFRNAVLLDKTASTYVESSPSTVHLKAIAKQIGNGPLKTQVTYNKYDNFGNAAEEKQEYGLYKCIIWSEFGDNITAVIENASFSEVQNALGYAPVNGTDVMAIDNLRNLPGMKNAMITTYTYYPHGNVKTKKDPRGIVTSYTYDAFLRPQGEFDNRGNMMKHIEYKNN